jgi:anti-sigma factor RsiW
MAQPTPETAFRYAGEEGVSTFYWVERNWGYALSGELARPQLLQAARSIYEQLST